MEDLQISKLPELEHAILIGAFSGWNDAASAASWAVKFLVNHWDAGQFAEIEPDGFYDFTETRPNVRIARGSQKQFSWPGTRFYSFRAPREGGQPIGRDVVLVLGEEPQLRWKAFSRAIVDLCRSCNVEDVVLLGALVGEVPHTARVQISGVATAPTVLRHMRRLDVELADYEGPTGILSALQETARKQSISTSSLWGMCPYYVSATPNLPVAEALLRKLDGLYGFGLQLHELTRAARRFNQRVSALVAEDGDVSAYVAELERRHAGGETPSTRGPSVDISLEDQPGLPSPEEAVKEVEAWLREFREQSGAE
jgi:proteasome assembly chaperone (PAC2) family protein